MRRLILCLSVATIAALVARSASAQATNTFMSGVGDDANPCSRTAPCATLAGTFAKTAAGGEMDIIDSGDFGLMQRDFQEKAILLDRIFDRVMAGQENLHIIIWARDWNIPSDDVLTWNQIAETLASAAGVSPRIVHVPSDAIAAADPDWGAGLLGDKAHSMVFDNAKLRSVVPDYLATISFEQGARESRHQVESLHVPLMTYEGNNPRLIQFSKSRSRLRGLWQRQRNDRRGEHL